MIRLGDISERFHELEKLGGLRFMTLHVLWDDPKNGVEIMDAIQRHHEIMREVTHNVYNKHPDKALRPSSGAIYPLLKKLEAQSLVLKRDDGKYELTETGFETIHKLMGGLHYSFDKPMERGEMAIDIILNEIYSYISLLSNFKEEKLQSKKENIRILIKKLTELEDSLK